MELDLTLLGILAGLVFATMEALKALGYITPGTSDAWKRGLAGLAAAVYTVVHVFFIEGVVIDTSNWLAIIESIATIATSAWGVATLAYLALRRRIGRVAEGENSDSGAEPPAESGS